MFCENCGNSLKETAKFCSKCGTAVAAQEEEASGPLESELPDFSEIAGHSLEGNLADFIFGKQSDIDDWFPDEKGAVFVYPDNVKVTTITGGIPIRDDTLELYDKYLNQWRTTELDGVPFTDRKIMSALKKRSSLRLRLWKFDFSAVLPDASAAECQVYYVTTNDSDQIMMGVGGDISEEIAEEFLEAWVTNARENNWKPRLPVERKKSADEFLSGLVSNNASPISVSSDMSESGRVQTSDRITSDDIYEWPITRPVDVTTDVPKLVAHDHPKEVLWALLGYERHIIDQSDYAIREPDKSLNITRRIRLEYDEWCVECLLQPNGPYRQYLPAAIKEYDGEDVTLADLDEGNCNSCSDAALYNYISNNTTEKIQQLYIWQRLEALRLGPQCDASDIESAPVNLYTDFRALILAKAVDVFSHLVALTKDQEDDEVVDDNHANSEQKADAPEPKKSFFGAVKGLFQKRPSETLSVGNTNASSAKGELMTKITLTVQFWNGDSGHTHTVEDLELESANTTLGEFARELKDDVTRETLEQFLRALFANGQLDGTPPGGLEKGVCYDQLLKYLFRIAFVKLGWGDVTVYVQKIQINGGDIVDASKELSEEIEYGLESSGRITLVRGTGGEPDLMYISG